MNTPEPCVHCVHLYVDVMVPDHVIEASPDLVGRSCKLGRNMPYTDMPNDVCSAFQHWEEQLPQRVVCINYSQAEVRWLTEIIHDEKALSDLAESSTVLETMLCPLCRTILVAGPAKCYETLVEHVDDPNGERSARATLICPTTTCAAHHTGVYWSLDGDGPFNANFKAFTWLDNNPHPFGSRHREIHASSYREERYASQAIPEEVWEDDEVPVHSRPETPLTVPLISVARLKTPQKKRSKS